MGRGREPTFFAYSFIFYFYFLRTNQVFHVSTNSILFLQEDPGESLSDCDKDDEESLEEEGCAKAEDDEESEDGFFVPDGYLSENEV